MTSPILDALYRKSPIGLQNLMVSVSGYSRNRNRYGKAYWEHRSWLEEFELWDYERKIEHQLRELNRFIKFARSRSPYYRDLLQGVSDAPIGSVDDLRGFPVLTKEDVRRNLNRLVTISRKSAVVGHTGGTTGKPLEVLYTPEDARRRLATLDHFKHRVGFENRVMKRATFSGQHIVPPSAAGGPYWRYNRSTRQMLYSTFHITSETVRLYVDSLREFRPHALDGFPSSLTAIARAMESGGLSLGYRPVAIFPTAETVTGEMRRILERVFQTKVFDQYASSEGAPFVVECPKQVAHIDLSSGVFERVGPNTNEILVTSFTTHGTPLIRYSIGDEMEFGGVLACECGQTSPVVNRILGKSSDFLYRANGAKLYGANISNLFRNLPGSVIRAQIEQHRRDEVVILLEVDRRRFREEEVRLLRREFIAKFGSDTKLTTRVVQRVPPEKSGKFRLIKNHLM